MKPQVFCSDGSNPYAVFGRKVLYMIQFCPYCGYHSVIEHQNGTCTCPKCQAHFSVMAVQRHPGTYLEEKWFDIPIGDGTYQISNQYRVRRQLRNGRFRNIAVYQKNNELYTCLYNNGQSKEYNVSNLLQKLKH